MPYSKEEIDRLVEEIGIPERLRERLVQATGEEALSEVSVALQRAAAKCAAEAWRKLSDRLLDYQPWAKLAEDPKSFNTELERVLADLRRWMKSVHGIPSHKPKKNTLRDREMFELRRLEKSFGEIGLKFKVSPKVAESRP